MADTNTTRTDLLLMETGAHDNDWGINLNADIQAIEDMVKATRSTATTGGTTTLTKTTAREPSQVITGVLVSNATIEVPATATSWWFFKNETTGAFSVTVKVTGLTGIVVPQGETKLLRCNGTDVVDLGMASQLAAYSSKAINVGTLTFVADAYAAVSNGFVTTLTDGLMVEARLANANATTTPTFNYNATGAISIVHADTSALGIGDMPNGGTVIFSYRTSTNKWYLMTLSAALFVRASNANTFTAVQTFSKPIVHAIQTLTDAASIAWNMATADNAIVTITASRSLANPTGAVAQQEGYLDIVMGGAGGWTLTWGTQYKGSGGARPETPCKDAGSTTRFHWWARGATDIVVTRMFCSARDTIGLYNETNLGAFANNTSFSTSHLLGKYPSLTKWFIECTTIDAAWAVGDRIEVSAPFGVNTVAATQAIAYATAASVGLLTYVNTPLIMNKTTRASVVLTIGSWDVVVRVYN